MLKILPNGTVQLTRGDTARLTVDISNDITSEKYEMDTEDKLVLTLKKKVKDDEIILQKTITGMNIFHIKPEDTENLEFAKYKYDVELTTAAGEVYTVITPSDFEIMQEVTY